jgi:hypothetical protein
MGRLLQIASNLVLYGFLVWLLYDSAVAEPDPWFAVVVGFVLVLSLIITFVPSLHARTISPGEYPYDD